MTPAPVRAWFKLVGVTHGELPDDWLSAEPSLMDEMRFPRRRLPTNIGDYERLIAYAVGKGKVFAAQRRAGAIRLNSPAGPIGSVTHRWPHVMEVETCAWVPHLHDAPALSAVLPDFTRRYSGRFWNGSHWRIDQAEYDALEQAILAAGTGQPVPPPPWSDPGSS